MINKRLNLLKLSAIASLCLCVFAGCKKDNNEAAQLSVKEQSSTAETQPNFAALAVPSNINTQFNHPDGTYTYGMASADFGQAAISGWNDGRAWISANWLRATLMPNSVSNGLIAGFTISDGSAYEATYKVRFHSQFDWSRGGKVGFGFLVGEGNTGCNIPTEGKGGSLRLMWYNTGSRVYFQPYVYHKDMAGPCGDTFGKTFPTSGSLVKGQTYTVHLYIKSNTGSNKDGWVQVKIDGNTVLDQSIRWTTNDAYRFINRLSFHNFRGGKDVAVWGSSQTSYIYFDDLVVNKVQ